MGLTRPNIKSCDVTSYNLFNKRAKKTKWIYTKYKTIPLKSHTAQRVSCLGTRYALRMLSNSFCLILGLFVVYIFICVLFLIPPVGIRVWLFASVFLVILLCVFISYGSQFLFYFCGYFNSLVFCTLFYSLCAAILSKFVDSVLSIIQPDWRCLGIFIFFFISACPKSAFESLYLQFMMLK